MQREGSAFSGLGVVMLKELSDHLTSVRMRVDSATARYAVDFDDIGPLG